MLTDWVEKFTLKVKNIDCRVISTIDVVSLAALKAALGKVLQLIHNDLSFILLFDSDHGVYYSFSDKMTSPLNLDDYLSAFSLQDDELMILPSSNVAAGGSSSTPIFFSAAVGPSVVRSLPKRRRRRTPTPSLRVRSRLFRNVLLRLRPLRQEVEGDQC